MSKGIRKFTAEELEELRIADAIIDAEEMTEEDYEISNEIDRILFPEKMKVRERNMRYYYKKKAEAEKAGKTDELKAKRKAAYEKNKESEKARKAKWYAENKDRIRAQQKAYYKKKKQKAAMAIA